MKIHEIKVHQEFDAPVEQVWEAFNDHVTFGKIMGQKVQRIVDSAEPGNVNGAGSVRSMRLPTGPFEETIIKSEKPALIEYKITKGTPLHYHYGTIQFTGLPDARSAVNYRAWLQVSAHRPDRGKGPGKRNRRWTRKLCQTAEKIEKSRAIFKQFI